jgi:hypothetical protein
MAEPRPDAEQLVKFIFLNVALAWSSNSIVPYPLVPREFEHPTQLTSANAIEIDEP